MKKLYTARVTFDFVVVADDQLNAFDVALANMREAFSDLDRYDVDMDVSEGVHAYKWDNDCIPYGGDGNTRTESYLKEKANESTRDSKTAVHGSVPCAGEA